jgi:leucyl aminopeptidase
MQISHSSQSLDQAACDWLIVPVFENGAGDSSLGSETGLPGGLLTRLREAGDVTGKPCELTEIRDLSNSSVRRTLFVGLGQAAELRLAGFEKSLMTAVRKISCKKVDHAVVLVPDFAAAGSAAPLGIVEGVRSAATSLCVGCVGQGLYKSEPERFEFGRATILTPEGAEDATAIQAALSEGQILGECINLTRELINRAPDDIYPETFASRAEQLASHHGIHCDILDPSRLRKERMGSMLAVAKGSERPPRMVVLTYRGGAKNAPTLALVGKGVTFDSGGLSLKPNDGMKTMKCDMSGAATVLGAVVAAARLKLPVNLTGFMGLVENMPGGRAYKLGDILTARNGVTIEVLNTDAEGRLVLADVLAYAVDQGVSKIIDLATLTGACVVALGEDVAGGFTNDQAWCDAVLAASKRVGEDIWQMPMFDSFAEQLKCDVADIKNVGTRWGGSITAAKFLERFVGETPWMHLDIAGPAFSESNKPHREGGASGAYVKTLIEVARQFT